MADNYLRFGMPSWVSPYFRSDKQVFGYVGDRDRVIPALTEKSFLRKILEVFARRLNVADLLKVLAGIPVLTSSDAKTISAEIMEALSQADAQKTLAELLKRHYTLARKNGRYFEGVALPAKHPVYGAPFSALQDHLVTVEGHLLHRDTIQQFNKVAATPVLKSSAQWLLSDFPPHCQSTQPPKANEIATGQFLLLKEDPGFTAAFGDYLPFCPDIGWYPNVRVTGFFGAPQLPLATMPVLSIGMIDYFPSCRPCWRGQ